MIKTYKQIGNMLFCNSTKFMISKSRILDLQRFYLDFHISIAFKRHKTKIFQAEENNEVYL